MLLKSYVCCSHFVIIMLIVILRQTYRAAVRQSVCASLSRNCVFIFYRSTVMSATDKMAAAVMSFLLVLLTTLCSHVNGDTVPRPRCPIVCECERSRVDCNYRDITEIPQLPINTENITMIGNNIRRIRARSFSEVPNLTEIYLEDNNIQSIDARAFEGLGLLRNLTLHENLSPFESGIFRFLLNLTFLEMRMAQISIPQGEICRLKELQQLTLGGFRFNSVEFERCFEDLRKLRVLTLSDMEQHNISDATFRPFRFSLTKLYVNKCGLRNLDGDTFKDFSKLTMLSLKDNSITHLPDTIFTSLTRLTYLDISSNNMSVISDTLLRPLRNLEYLFFGGRRKNNLVFGEEFLNMTRLRKIAFYDGPIQSLDNDTFRHLCHCPITDISLFYCDIWRISKDAFQTLRNIESLSFYMNGFITGPVLHDAFYGLNGSPLRRLYLSFINLSVYTTDIFEGLNVTNITNLVMNASQITVIKKGLFRNLGTVSKLDLSLNNINRLEDDSFKELVKLSTLIIDK